MSAIPKPFRAALANALAGVRPNAVLNKSRDGYDEAAAETWYDARTAIANVLAVYCDGFDRDRFTEATERFKAEASAHTEKASAEEGAGK